MSWVKSPKVIEPTLRTIDEMSNGKRSPLNTLMDAKIKNEIIELGSRNFACAKCRKITGVIPFLCNFVCLAGHAIQSYNAFQAEITHSGYVCLTNPTSVPTLYHTVVHLACSAGHATNEAQAVSNSWSQLAGHNFKTWDDQTLYYYHYRDGAGFSGTPTTVGELLSTSNGNCVAWMELFRNALSVNGVTSDRIWIESPVSIGFLVKDWTDDGTPIYTNTPPYNWQLRLPTNAFTMVPAPTSSVYGDLTSLTNLPGQNSSPPSEKFFGNHRIARYDNVYYDPSYGVIFSSSNDFYSVAVYGCAHDEGDSTASNGIYRVKLADTNVCEITFTAY